MNRDCHRVAEVAVICCLSICLMTCTSLFFRTNLSAGSAEAEHLRDTAVQIHNAILHQLKDATSAAEAVQSTPSAGAQQQAGSGSVAANSVHDASAGLQSSAEASVQHNPCLSSSAQQHAGSGVGQAAPADKRQEDGAKAKAEQQVGAETSQQLQIEADGGEPKADGGEPKAGVGEPRVGCGEPKADGGEPKADCGEPRADGGGHRGNGGELKADVGGHRGSGGEPKAVGGQQQRRRRTAHLRDNERQSVGGKRQSVGGKRQSVGGKRTREVSEEDLDESPGESTFLIAICCHACSRFD